MDDTDSGGSRISQGVPTHKVIVKSFGQFFSRKLHENERKIGKRGGRPSLVPPLNPPLTYNSFSTFLRITNPLPRMTNQCLGMTKRLVKGESKGSLNKVILRSQSLSNTPPPYGPKCSQFHVILFNIFNSDKISSVIQEVNLRILLHAGNEAHKQGDHPGFETKGRHHYKSTTGESVAPQKALMSSKILRIIYGAPR